MMNRVNDQEDVGARSIVVTGGAGFIGSHLVERLLDAGNVVTVLDRQMGKNLREVVGNKNFTFVQVDVRDAETLHQLVPRDATHIFHLSSIVGIKHYMADPLGVMDVNVGGTRNVLEVARARDAKVLLTSTSEVFGKNPKTPWKEDDDRVLGSTSVDRWSYSSSKAVAEHMVLAAHKAYGLKATVTRFFNVYGPRQPPDLLVSQSIFKALRGERPLLYDGGSMTRCLTYVDDAVEGTLRAMFYTGTDGEVFNLGNPREVTVRQVVEAVLKHAGTVDAWEDVDTAQRFGKAYEDILRRVPDVAKAERVLDWRAEVPMEVGVRRTVEWARAEPEWLVRA